MTRSEATMLVPVEPAKQHGPLKKLNGEQPTPGDEFQRSHTHFLGILL